MVELDYEVADIGDGSLAVIRSDGAAVSIEAFEIMFELHKQNPRFFEVWLELAENYLLMGLSVGEA